MPRKNPLGLTPEQKLARAAELHAQGFTIRQIAKIIGVSNQSAAALCRQAGCKMRKPGEHNRTRYQSIANAPRGTLPASHPARAVDEAILRDQAMLAAADARRALRIQAA